MSTEKYLFYRGDLQAVAAVDGASELAFVTVHPEGHPTAIYRLDAEKMALTAADLPCGGRAILADGKTWWVAGTDGHIYRLGEKNKAPVKVGEPLPAPPNALALLSGDRLAVLAGKEIQIRDRSQGKVAQSIALDEPGLCLAADPSGEWLVAGGGKGTIWVFTCEERDAFVLSESDRLHEGAVAALMFEPGELRFYSSGLDQKLLLTHARGKLEPEDRGRGNSHTDRLTAMILAPGDRFLTGGHDATVKSWPRAGAARPATLKDGVGRVVGLAIVTVHTRHQVAVACQDNTLRFFVIDAAGKIGQATAKVRDIYAWADHEFKQTDARQREAALKRLAELNDAPAVDRIARRIAEDADHGLRLLAAQLLADMTHPRIPSELEKHLQHRDEAVRLAVLHGLRRQLGPAELRPLDLALAADKAEIGVAAVQALEELASQNDQALSRLVKSLNGKPYEVRAAALAALERVHGEQSPTANVQALESKQADIRRLALVRLFQRNLLDHPQVASALRRSCEDADSRVRHTAFLVSCMTRPHLVQTLRKRDPDLDRQFSELENFDQEAQKNTEPAEPPAKEQKPSKKKAKASKTASAELSAADCEPLLQAAASRMLDTCLRGARGLALLEDPRALGLLMQLSRESDASARVEVCRALGALDDPRSAKRLWSMLGDSAPEVRDAAFTALAKIYAAEPRTAADAGLSAAHEDVRRRALEILMREVRKKPPKKPDDPGWDLVRRVLNDSFPGVRSEAFKAVLNLQLGGGGANTLRFVLESVHEDVRREALTEIMAQLEQPWSQPLLWECFNDPSPTIRAEAFAFAAKRAKGSDLSHLEAALQSRWDDIRREAVNALVHKRTKAAQELLARALEDEDLKVRQLALDGLVEADAAALLADALKSTHADIRVRAARALARHGDAAVLTPLLEMATAEEPQDVSQRDTHYEVVGAALGGLAELGDPAALVVVAKLLDHKHAPVREAASQALVWTVREDTLPVAQAALRNADPQVKHRAALTLAVWGDASAASLVFSDAGQKILDIQERLSAALALERVAEDQLTLFLDTDAEAVRNAALAMLLLLEWRNHDGTPQRCLAALSSEHPRVRLAAARALECFADPARFQEFLTQLINDRGDQPAWTISSEDVQTLAVLIACNDPLLRARTARLLLLWGEEKQTAWDQAWRLHQERFAKEIAACRKQDANRKLPPLAYDEHQLRELAMGAYIGLVREQGLARGRTSGAGPLVLRIRQTALRRLAELAASSGAFRDAARPVMIQALGDPNQDVRFQAFDQLHALGMDSSLLGAEAIATGHADLAVRGMKLLIEGASSKDSVQILEQVMLSRSDSLAIEAARLLIERQGVVKTAEKALEAPWETLAGHAVSWLTAEYSKDEKAKKLLHRALESRFRQVRIQAALELAQKKDSQALSALLAVLNEPIWSQDHRQAAVALQQLGDPRAADAFLDRIEKDPQGASAVLLLFPLAGGFRERKVLPRLLAMMEKKEWRNPAFLAALTISGYDQPIEDPDEERPDRNCLKKQHPRHDDVLTQLAERCLDLGDAGLLLELAPALRWAPEKHVDPLLATLAAHSDPRVRHAAVEAIGWRVRKRGADPAPLLKALEHRDAETKFIAAEALARAGRSDGLSILLSGVELMSDIDLRRRAVQALGELADERALDLLIKLADENNHALQEEAAEAIGRLGKSEKADEIFQILQRLVKLEGGLAEKAIRGLRHLNTEAGWRLIREQLRVRNRYAAAEVLGYNDDPATRELLLDTLASYTSTFVLEAVYRSARRLFGPDSLEPDYALVRSIVLRFDDDDELGKAALDRVCKFGDASRIFAVLSRVSRRPIDVFDLLAKSLLRREPLPVKEAQQALQSQHARIVEIAACILGRSGDKKLGKTILAALEKWRGVWDNHRDRLVPELPLSEITNCLARLIWAAGRLDAAEDVLIAVVTERPGDPCFRPLRRAAVTALAESKPSPAALDALVAAATCDDADVRSLASSAIARWAPQRAPELIAQTVGDRVALSRLATMAADQAAASLKSAIASSHYQGAALPHLIAAGDVEGLYAAAQDTTLPETTRLGAIEALAKLAREDAEEMLVALGANSAIDEELRKAAWRGRRRSQRARMKTAGAAAS